MNIITRFFSWLRGADDAGPTGQVSGENLAEKLASGMNRGRDHMQAGAYDLAAAEFRSVVDLMPIYGAGYLDLAGARHLNGEDMAALRDLDTAIALIPRGMERAAAYHNRGMVNESLERYDAAISDFKMAKDGGFEPAGAELTRMRERKATVERESGIEPVEAPNVVAMCELAKSICSQQPLEALVLFTKALEYAPDHPDAAYGRGIANVSLNLVNEAIVDFDRTLELEPERTGLRAEALFNRASLLANRGQIGQAISDLAECHSLASDDEIAFPVFGDAAKEKAMIEGIQTRLERLRSTAQSRN